MNKQYLDYQNKVESALQTCFATSPKEYEILFDAMRYSVLGGGKRIRAVMMLECARQCGLDENAILPYACAIEMIHASTLIHDDMPCMDDDDYRRGKLSCHKKFGEDIALLAGDALYSFAIETVLRQSEKHEYVGSVVSAITSLVALGGADGVFAGQILDKKYETQSCSLENLIYLHSLKTGALFNACGRVPCILSHVETEVEKSLNIYLKNLGLAFQVKDDILDVEGDFSVLGKAIGADVNKTTFVSLLGLQESKEYLRELIAKAKEAVSNLGDNSLLLWICDYVMNRNL